MESTGLQSGRKLTNHQPTITDHSANVLDTDTSQDIGSKLRLELKKLLGSPDFQMIQDLD